MPSGRCSGVWTAECSVCSVLSRTLITRLTLTPMHIAAMPCTHVMEPCALSGTDRQTRNGTVWADPGRDGRGKPAGTTCPDALMKPGIELCRKVSTQLCRLSKIKRTGWRDAGREGPHPKMKPGTGPLAAVPPGGRGTLPRSAAEPVPYGGCCADP